jgi:5-formyltetrahydrofolate cyclo-ligase
MSEDRSVLRRALRERRRQTSVAERIAAAARVAEQLTTLPEWQTDERIGGYWALPGELPLNLVAAACARAGKTWHLPVVGDDARLTFVAHAAGDAVVPNRYGIPEPVGGEPVAPESLQLVLVPLVAFDRNGNRLGSGAGYYDRSFAFLREGERPREPLLVGVAFGFQEVEALAAEAWDVKLDLVITESEVIEIA